MKKILTIILDGFGISEDVVGNAINKAGLKNFESFYNNNPHTLLEASGEKVGLDVNEFGNSEVGHTLIGAGRYIKQKRELVNDFLDKDYKENYKFNNIVEDINKTYHIVGLCSDGKVHADVEHFLKLYDILVEKGITNINFHLITDGRDTGACDAIKYIQMIEERIKEKNIGKIATICGRYYAMDRDDNIDRTSLYYNLLTQGIGVGIPSALSAIEACYKKGMTDEFIKPMITDVTTTIKDGDVIFWMNYRNDRAKQIIESFTNIAYNKFPIIVMQNLKVCSFMNVDLRLKTTSFIEKEEIKNPLGLYLSKLNLTQTRIAESEKFAHVTYFFDGGYNDEIKGCKKIEVASPNVATYDMQPEMSAVEVTKKVIENLQEDIDFILVNFANPDMVGHTGDLNATMKACSAVDICLGKIFEVAEENFYKIILLADHGNADRMIEPNGDICKTHTMAKVPFVINDPSIEMIKDGGTLINVAPTILKYMDIAIPLEMEETEILIKQEK